MNRKIWGIHKEVNMAKYNAMTQEWLDAWKQKISESKEYREIMMNIPQDGTDSGDLTSSR